MRAVFDRSNIVSNEDKLRAFLQTQAYLESLPKTDSVPAQKGSKMTRSLAANFETVSFFPAAGSYSGQKCRFANARPEPVLR